MRSMRACVLCGRQDADCGHFNGRVNVAWIQCPDCGWYGLTEPALEATGKLPLDSPGRLNLISHTPEVQAQQTEQQVALLWKCSWQKIDQPEGLPKIIHNVEDYVSMPIRHSGKPDELLRLLATKLSTKSPFDEVELSIGELRALKIANWSELSEWMDVLAAEKLVNWAPVVRSIQDDAVDGPMPRFNLTPGGWDRAEKLFGSAGSTMGFIAMAFELPEREEVQKAIENACESNGWKAKTVNQHEFTGAIMDRVVTEINRARFVVADFTDHKMGVYYEAGYAEGRRVQVIYTVREDQMKLAHFDTRHLNHIAWKNPAELGQRLQSRIGAVIGRGPLAVVG
jgi:hypothetical protein